MALLHSLEKEGNFLFKYRGQFPILLFVFALPVIYFSKILPDQNITNLLTVIAIALSVTGFLIRAYTIGTTPKGTSGRNTENQVAEVLNSTGIYSVVRHPLYLGNYFMWIGIVLYTFNIYFTIIITLAYWLYYERIMFAEERFLEKKFGKQYLDWSLRAPAFIPSLSNFVRSSIPFSLRSVLRREYSGVLATVIGFVYIDVLRNYFTDKEEIITKNQVIILVASGLLTLILRSLKHYTKVLTESDRS